MLLFGKLRSDFQFLLLFCMKYAALGYGEVTGCLPKTFIPPCPDGYKAPVCRIPGLCICEALGKHCKLQRVTMNSKLNLV